MSYQIDSPSKGFTLIEVLIALIVVSVGVMGVVQLQSKLSRAVTDSEMRAAAYSAAESVMESAKEYSSKTEFTSFDADALFSYLPNLPEGMSLAEQSDVIFYDADNNIVSASEASYKQIKLVFDWNNDESMELTSVIAYVDSYLSELGKNEAGSGGASPQVSHAAGSAPDVIPIDLGNGSLKETSKPLPEINQAQANGSYGSTEVAFSTVTYDSSTNKEINEDFVTVNCKCELDQATTSSFSSLGSGQRAAKTYYDEVTKKLAVDYPQTGEFVSKATGSVAETGQSFLCDRCCRDHHDQINTPDTVEPRYRWYWDDSAFYTSGNGDHKHYLVDSSGVQTPALLAGDEYLENCRFKRIDGIYRLMQDWKLVDITVMPSNYLADGSQGLTDYTTYVASVAESMLDQSYAANTNLVASSPSVAKPSGRDLVSGAMGSIAVGESVQVLSRSLYADDLTSSAVASIGAIKASGDSWLDKIPLYEVNTTKLAEWSSASSAIASVDSDPVVAIDDPENDYYGTYFRGRVTGVASGATSVSAESFITNTGLVGHVTLTETGYVWTDSFFDPNNSLADSIDVEVSNTLGTSYLSGTILCRYYKNGGEPDLACSSPKDINDSSLQPEIEVLADGTLYNCTVVMNTDAEGSFSCPSVPDTASSYNLRITPASTTSLYFSSLTSQIESDNLGYPQAYSEAVSSATYSLSISNSEIPLDINDIKANIYKP